MNMLPAPFLNHNPYLTYFWFTPQKMESCEGVCLERPTIPKQILKATEDSIILYVGQLLSTEDSTYFTTCKCHLLKTA